MRRFPNAAAAALLGGAMLIGAPAFAQPAGSPPGPGAGPGAGPGPGPGGARQGGPRGMETMFVEIDANKDGRASWDEVWIFVQRRFTTADADRNGGLSQAEMQAAMPQRPQGRPARDDNASGPRAERHAEMAGAMFRALDANRDGQVTLEEVRPAVEARFRALDANADNSVARDELPQRHGRGGPRGGPGGGPGGAPGGAPAAPANPG